VSLLLNQVRETPYNLQFVFVGEMYQWQFNSAFAAGITNYQIHTSTDKFVHLIGHSYRTASTAVTVRFIELPVFVSTGTSLLPAYDVNRLTATTPTMGIYSNPSATSGTIIEDIKLISGNTWSQVTPEFILERGSDYLIQISNAGSTAKKVDFSFAWYESGN